MPSLQPVPSTTVKAKHHHISSALPSNALPLSQAQDPMRRSLSYIDRDSAIALGTILLFILTAALYCLHLRIRERSRADLEEDAERVRRANTGTWRSYGSRSRAQEAMSRERVWSWAISEGSLPRGSFSTLRGSISGLFKKDREGSWPTSSSVSSAATTRVGSANDIPLPDVCAWHHRGRDHSISRYQSPHRQYRLWASSTPGPHGRQASVRGVPDPILEDLQARRSLTGRRQDRRSSSGLRRRGSAAHLDRRLSVLESIAEPGPGIELPARAMSCEANGIRSGLGQVSNSRSAYDWSRPSVDAAENVKGELVRVEVQKHDEFRRVVWDRNNSPRESLIEAEGGVTEPKDMTAGEVARKDWASGRHDL